MNYQNLNAVSTAVIALATVFGVMFAMIYYLRLIVEINIIEAVLSILIYIVVILSFLYILKRKSENEKGK